MKRSGSANLRERSNSPMRRRGRRLPSIPRPISPTRSTSDINFPEVSLSPTRRKERSLSPSSRELCNHDLPLTPRASRLTHSQYDVIRWDDVTKNTMVASTSDLSDDWC